MWARRCLLALVFAGALGAGGVAQAEGDRGPGSPASVQDPPRAQATARLAEAEQARSAGRFGEALGAYRDVIAIDPTAPAARTARARADDLEAHAEGGFEPLAKLEAVRRDPSKSGDRTAIEALERDLAGFPAGRVRAEAAVMVAQAFWHRLGDPRRAVAPLTFAVEDTAADRLTRSLALSELAAALRELGDLGAARSVVDRYPDLAPGTRAEIRRLYRRVQLRTASIALLSLLAMIGIASLVRVARRLGGAREVRRAVTSPLAVAASLYLGGAAAALVRIHGEGDPRPFLWLGLGVLSIDVIARAWRVASGDRRAAARTVRAVTCAASVLAAAFLSIERTNAGYLESFGL